MIFLAGLVSSIGFLPLASLAGGPIGIVIAWLAREFASGAIKWIMIGIGGLLVTVCIAGITLHLAHLEQAKRELTALQNKVTGWQHLYGCGNTDLTTCYAVRVAKENKKLHALQRQAASAQAQLDAMNATLQETYGSTDAFISKAAKTGDGPLPRVLIELYGHERKERGLKP